MALEKQNVPIDFRFGLENKGDTRLSKPESLNAADDLIFDDADTLVPRNGFSAQNTTNNNASFPMAAGRRLFPNRDMLVIEHEMGAHRVVPNQGVTPILPSPQFPILDTVSTNAKFMRASMLTTPVSGAISRYPSPPGGVTSPVKAGNYDCGVSGNFSLWAWEEWDTDINRMTIRWNLVRESDKSLACSGVLHDWASSVYHYVQPRVVCIGAHYFLYFGKTNTDGIHFSINTIEILVATSNTTSETAVFTSSAGAATTADRLMFDLDYNANPNKLMLAVQDINVNWTQSIIDLSPTDGLSILGTWTKNPASRAFQMAALVTQDNDGPKTVRLTAFFSPNGAGTTLRAWARDVTGAATSADTLVSTADYTVGRIAGIDPGAGSTDSFHLVFDAQAAVTGYPSTAVVGMRATTFRKNLAAGAPLLKYCFNLWAVGSRPVKTANGRTWMTALLLSGRSGGGFGSEQPCAFVIDIGDIFARATATLVTPPQVVARLGYLEGGHLLYDWATWQRVPGGFTDNGNVLTLPHKRFVADAQTQGLEVTTPEQVARADVDFSAAPLGFVEANGLTLLAGACPWVYDGEQLVEEGFHHAPEFTAATVTAGAGFPLGTMNFCYTVGWEDARGNWHESAPSRSIAVTTTPGNLTVTFSVFAPPTMRSNARLILYRTPVGASAGSGVYYRAMGTTGAALIDASLIDSTPLYTTGGVLENSPMPACKSLLAHDGRIFWFGSEDGRVFGFSKPVADGAPPKFNFLQRVRAPDEFGRVAAGMSVDAKLFVFGEKRIGAIFGEGPNDLGEQNGYSPLTTVTSEIGLDWNAPTSLVLEPNGIWFEAPAGLRLLGQNGKLLRHEDGQEVGSEVDNYDFNNIVRAVRGPAKQQIRFYTDGGMVLVWDFQWRQWSRFTNHTSTDSCYANGLYYHLTVASPPALLFYDETAYKDLGATPVAPYVELPWLHFAGVQGFQRVYRVSLVGNVQYGDTTESQTMTVKAGYNYGPVTTEVTADVAPYVTGSHGTFQFQHALLNQKCEALKLAFSWVGKAAASRLRLTNITLQVGVKKGMFKMPGGSVI